MSRLAIFLYITLYAAIIIAFSVAAYLRLSSLLGITVLAVTVFVSSPKLARVAGSADVAPTPRRFRSRRSLLENASTLLLALLHVCCALAWARSGSLHHVLLDSIAAAFFLYGAIFARAMSDFGEPREDVPRHALAELRRPRFTVHRARLARRMLPLRVAWMTWAAGSLYLHAQQWAACLLARAPLVATFHCIAAFAPDRSAPLLFSLRTLAAACMSAGVALVLVLGVVSAYSACACSARDFSGRLTPHEASWLWPSDYAGEMPHQVPPLRGHVDGTSSLVSSTSSRSSSRQLHNTAFPRPLRIVFLTIGTRGDVQPFIVLGQHLRESGHTVVIATTRDFKGMVEGAGIEYADTGVDRIEQPSSWVRVSSVAEMIEASVPQFMRGYGTTSLCFRDACTVPARADVIVGTAMTLTFALNVGASKGIPVWLAKLAPDIVSRGFCPPGSSLSSMGWLNIASNLSYWLRVALAVSRTGVTAAEDLFRTRDLELEPLSASLNTQIERINDMKFTPQLLGFSSALFPKPTDYPEWAFEVGFWLSADGSGGQHDPHLGLVSRELRSFVEEASPNGLVVVTFGSMVNASRPTLQGDIVQCLLHCGLHVLLITGWGAPRPEGVPAPGSEPGGDPHLCIVAEALHAWLFPHALFVVHHGGAGTTSRALACGVPSIVIPVLRWSDQPLWGLLAQTAGVGVLVAAENPSPADIHEAIMSVLAGNRVDAPRTGSIMREASNRVGATVRAERSVALAQTLLEACLCNLVLPPGEADVVRAQIGVPVPQLSSLSLQQRMCFQHCVPCARSRAEGWGGEGGTPSSPLQTARIPSVSAPPGGSGGGIPSVSEPSPPARVPSPAPSRRRAASPGGGLGSVSSESAIAVDPAAGRKGSRKGLRSTTSSRRSARSRDKLEGTT